ncbi:hypothetical protein N7471_013578 [Penicillium samsonianum]|uniref:uncharacterized protein n=1 Tax=Penicillium samsonianum TaxID=1882272 RepID=UPI0025488958|nr:uncharacterized protein N7471_013578 [Penicillium samsonianum]KAJ6118958.1 hypothetical protein N7471_013578 [Penicillium samsonianum]
MEQLVPYWALFCTTKTFIEEFMANQEALNKSAFVRPNWPCEQLPQCLLDADNYLQDIEYEVAEEAQGAAGGSDVLTHTVVRYLEKIQSFLDQNVDDAAEMDIIDRASQK